MICASCGVREESEENVTVQNEIPTQESTESVTVLEEQDTSEQLSELQYYRSLYNEGKMILDELDKKRAVLREEAAKPYEQYIISDYQADYDYNKYVIGHIKIDDTVIDAPVLQSLEDYEYYLHRDIDGVLSEPGCIILDADSEIGIGTKTDGYLNEYNPTPIQLVHGHNMRNGTMFGSLLKYENETYAAAHNIIFYDSIYEKRKYEVVGAFYSQIYPKDSDEFKYYDIENITTFDDAMDWYGKASELFLYNIGSSIEYGDEIIVLSTCAYQVTDGRFAVVGKRLN